MLNIMMDADSLYPKGFHPAVTVSDASGAELAYPKRRRDVGGVKYYFIDFGISSRFEADEERKVIGVLGQDQDVPELSFEVPYDPFLTDVFIIGNLIKREFIEVRVSVFIYTGTSQKHSVEIYKFGFCGSTA